MSKILVDISQLALKKYTGISYYLFYLLDNIEKSKRDNVILLSPFREIPSTFRSSYKVECWGIGKNAKDINWFVTLKRNYLGYYFMHRMVNKISPDVFWGPNFVIPKGLNKSIRKFVHVHDMIIFNDRLKEQKYSFKKRILGSIFLSQVRYSILNSDAILTVSNSVANRINDFFPDHSLKIEIIYPGVDRKLFKYTKDTNKLSNYGINERFVMGINMRAQRKNFVKLVNAFEKVKANGFLCLVGTLSEEQIAYGKKTLGERFKYLGYISDEDLPVIYSAANAIILSSSEEGFDLPAIEARACGTPVIASDIDIHKEILDSEADYFELDNEQKLVELINNRLVNSKENLPSKIVEKYSWDLSAKKLIGLLIEMG